MTRVAVLDHGAGNIVSIAQGLVRAGATVTVAARPAEIDNADGIVLPGVGRTGAAMRRLTATRLDEALRDWQAPLLGVCVGMQLLFDESDEDGETCLGLIGGRVERLDDAPLLPHIGWNDVALAGDRMFEGIPSGEPFYFVHTFAPRPTSEDVVVGWTTYGTRFPAAVRSGHRWGVQFHPERSGHAGLRVLSNFVDECAGVAHAA